MAAIQEVNRLVMGIGRLEIFPQGATRPIKLADLNDIGIDAKVDQKEVWGEGSWATGVADGRKTLEIMAKHYRLNLTDIANDFGVAAPVAGTTAVAFDEAAAVPATTPFTVPLVNAATYQAGTLDLYVYVKPASGSAYPVPYKIVAAGSEVAGAAASVSAAGVITFAAGDAGLALSATYQYGNVTGQQILLNQTYQNSSPFYSMKFWKRDRSPIDGSVGILQFELFAVRPGGFNAPFREGEISNFEKRYRAYPDPLGNVMRVTLVNV